MKRREPTEEQIDETVAMLVAHMKAELEKAGMNASPAAVKLACKRRVRSRLALQALTDGARGAGSAP